VLEVDDGGGAEVDEGMIWARIDGCGELRGRG
jgi:hypothetical protein